MLDLSNVLVSAAYAQEAAPAPVTTQSALMNYLPFVLIFAVFYFLVIRPQQKRLADQEKMVKALQRGDRVVTSSGIHGKISKLDERQLMLEVADGVEIKIDRENIAALETPPEAAAKEGEKK